MGQKKFVKKASATSSKIRNGHINNSNKAGQIYARWMHFTIWVGIFTVILAITAYASADRMPFYSYLVHFRVYPWLPSLFLSICILLLAELPASPALKTGLVTNPALPKTVQFFAGLISGIHFTLLKWEKILLLAGSLSGLAYLWLFPTCIEADEILVSFKIMKGGDIIATASLGDTVTIKENTTYRLEVSIDSASSGKPLPFLECLWLNTGLGDTRLLNTAGCKIDFQSGQDEIPDPVSAQFKQWHCPLSKPYPFFIQTSQ